MSASTERKLRQAAREAGTDKKTLAQQEEAKKKAVSKRRWTLGTVAVILLIALIFFLDSGFLYKGTTALTVGDEKYSPAEVNYAYASQYINTVNQYGSYASMFGLDTSAGLSGLDKQQNPMGDGTWKDYFLSAAKDSLRQTKALTDYAAAQGIALDEEEIAQVDSGFDGLDDYARAQGFAGGDSFFAVNYGNGVTVKLARQASLDQALASKAYSAYYDGISYTDQELEDYYQSLEGSRDTYDYASYLVAAAMGEDEDAPSETALTEAAAEADAIVYAYKDGGDIEDVLERFQAAVDMDELGHEAQVSRSVSAGSLSPSFKEWLTGERSPGDVTVIAGDEGSTVLLFLDHSDNHYPTVSVRHILINAEADEEGNWSEEALSAARARAEEILAEWKAGEQTEESFAALAEQYSEDGGSNTNGGLYEDVYKGQMVEEFNDFCFGDRKPGDTAVVFGSNGSYAGYHVIYFVGEGPLYSSVIAESAKRSEAMNQWMDELTAAYEVKDGFGLRFVG